MKNKDSGCLRQLLKVAVRKKSLYSFIVDHGNELRLNLKSKNREKIEERIDKKNRKKNRKKGQKIGT